MTPYAYYQDIALRHPKLSKAEERAVIRQLFSGRDNPERAGAVDKLIRHNIWFALYLVRKRVNSTAWFFDDVVAAGIDGLHTAVRRLRDTSADDPGVGLRAFGRRIIDGAIVDALSRAPVVAVTKYGRTKANRRKREESVSGTSTVAPVARCEIVHLDAPSSLDEGAATLHNIFTDDHDDPAVQAERRIDLEEAIARLPDKFRQVIETRFGLGDEDVRGQTQKVAAARLKVTPQRLQQIEQQALQSLRSFLAEPCH